METQARHGLFSNPAQFQLWLDQLIICHMTESGQLSDKTKIDAETELTFVKRLALTLSIMKRYEMSF